MSEVNSSLIYHGFWVNHARGPILGATLTTDQRSSNVIIALLAIIVSVAAGSAWNLLLFAVHQARATSNPKDGLYRQQQVLYRSLATPGSVLTDSVKLLRVWRQDISGSLSRCAGPAIVAMLFALAALAAGIFSSYAVTTTDLEVLVGNSHCKFVNFTKVFSINDETETVKLWSLDFDVKTFARTYSEQCFGAGPVPSRCNFYVHPRIDTSTGTADCPFNSSICQHLEHNALTLDSDYLDSNDVLGINARPRDRVQFRKMTTCNPLRISEYTTMLNGTDPVMRRALKAGPLPSEVFWILNYGKRQNGNFRALPGNATTVVSSIKSNVTNTYTTQAVRYFSAPEFATASSFTPIDPLFSDEDDVIVLFIGTNAVTSYTPVDDPVYAAHRPRPYYSGHKTQNSTAYWPDFSMGAIGCREKYEYCLLDASRQRHCTKPRGATASELGALLPAANSMQKITMELIGYATASYGLADAGNLMPPLLDSNAHIVRGSVNGLPIDQWKSDVKKLDNYIWAAMRTWITTNTAGWPSGMDEFLQLPSTPGEKQFCRSQKVIKPGGFANVSVFALAFTLVVSAVLVIVDYTILRGLLLLDSAKRRLSPGLRYWIEDGIFQLQRAAYSAKGTGPWARTDKEIPKTAPGLMLSTLSSYTTPTNVTKPPSQAPSNTSPAASVTPVTNTGSPNAAPVNSVTSLNAPAPSANASTTQVSTSAGSSPLNPTTLMAPGSGSGPPTTPVPTPDPAAASHSQGPAGP